MQVEILYRPAYSMAIVNLAPFEEIRVEAGSMVGMTDGMQLQTRMEGGLFRSLQRSLEDFFYRETQSRPVVLPQFIYV